jgi:isopenicillin-N epimerase
VIEFIGNLTGAKVVVASIPFPINSETEIIDLILEKVSPKTKLFLVDHIISQTALIFPIQQLISKLAELGIDTLIDGAHAPGSLNLNLKALNPAYYTGNCHKWLCAPKGAAFLYIRRDKQAKIRPLVISHGANSPRVDISRFRVEFDWLGTDDPTAYLAVPAAIKFMGSLLPGGWNELQERNHNLVIKARNLICETLNIPQPNPDKMIASMASIPLWDVSNSDLSAELLHKQLREQFKIQVPIIPWESNQKMIRISAQIYNDLSQYEHLAKVLKQILKV